MTNALTVASQSAAKPRTRVNWTAAEKADWLALYEESGQSVSEFCRTNDLPPATLSAWRSQQKGDAGSPIGDESGALIEVSAAALLEAPIAPVRMDLPCGVPLEVPTGTDPVWLGALLKTLLPMGR
jgi:transposase-like protein